jgi:hypothetical protein
LEITFAGEVLCSPSVFVKEPTTSEQDPKNKRTRRSNLVSLRVLCVYRTVLLPTCISAGRRVRHHLTLLNAIPAAEQTGVVPAPVRAVEQVDAQPAAAALTADALPQAERIDVPAAGLAANIAVAADCTAAQAVKAEAPTLRWSSALRARAGAHGLNGRGPHRVRDRLRHPQAAALQFSVWDR